jgi:hypothetical protein
MFHAEGGRCSLDASAPPPPRAAFLAFLGFRAVAAASAALCCCSAAALGRTAHTSAIAAQKTSEL